MNWFRFGILHALLFVLPASSLFAADDTLDRYNVVWNIPGEDHNDSMPIGNGDIGLNVWTEPDGELVILIAKSDAWSGNARLLKLGRLRLTVEPDSLKNAGSFKQTLHLRQGEIEIAAVKESINHQVRIWVDANRPVIHIETESNTEHQLNVDLDLWRTEKRQLTGDELHSAYGLNNAPFPVYVHPDTIIETGTDRIVWFHRNRHSIWQNNLTHQGLGDLTEQLADPLLKRSFGAAVYGDGLTRTSPSSLQSNSPQKRHHLSIVPHVSQTETSEQWLEQLDASIQTVRSTPIDTALAEHRDWWNRFWNRSWIFASGTPEAETVTRGYILQRWINACAGRGEFPIKFNGTLFTVDGAGYDADYRRWGGPYWWQNTRLPYWPMLAGGDFDMMQPLFEMYQNMLPLQEARTQTWFGHSGSFIGETVYFWGMYTNDNYGWERPETMPVGELTNTYIHREYTASLELLSMMIDYFNYTQDEGFVRERLLPMSDSLLTFWDQHYKTDQNGILFFYPAQALETLQDAMNPTPDIAGLRWTLNRLLEIEPDLTGEDRRTFWQQLKQKIPPLPMERNDESAWLLGAEKYFGGRGNSENPELYAIFPFRLFGVNKPDLDIGRETFERRTVIGHVGWRQDDTQAALLGLTETAQSLLSQRASVKHEESRFPAFWGPNFDWIPDQDHGGNLMKAFQTMLLQTDDGKIILMPAWPDEWNASFKLHAPRQTILEGEIENGHVTSLNVSPSERESDIIKLETD